jgi:tetratricopeptide (TPR) repeat protein
MTEPYNIQCLSCGTFYNDLQEVCPYCGEPQPDPSAEAPIADEGYGHNANLAEEPGIEDFDAAYVDDEIEPYELTPQVAAEDYEQEYLPGHEAATAGGYYDDDAYAIAGQAEYPAQPLDDDYDDDDDYYDDDYYESYPEESQTEGYDDYDEAEEVYDDTSSSGIFTWRRVLSGCLVAFACFALIYAGVGLLAVREGLEERTLLAQTESQAHFEKGQDHMESNAIELAIAEFERALSLNPNFPAARQALREAQRIAQDQPTPTSQARSAAATDLLVKAEAQIEQQSWDEAVETLSQVRDLDPEYQADHVSELLYTANYQLGLELKDSDQLEDALAAFENALAERPGNPQVLSEQDNTLLYIDGLALESIDIQRAIEIFSQLYRQDANYLDVKERLSSAYETHGDELARADAWCRAENHYNAAKDLNVSRAVEIKAENSSLRCEESEEVVVVPTAAATNTPAAPARTASTDSSGGSSNNNNNGGSSGSGDSSSSGSAVQPTATITTSNVAAQRAPSGGSIVFSEYNPFESRWEIHAVPASGGSRRALKSDATMPAISPNGQLLLYHSESTGSEGLHAFNLSTGEDTRVTTVRAHILPKFSGDSNNFVFVAQEGGTGRWQVHRGYADAKSPSSILTDGRTPAWSANGRVVAVQSTDPIGNNPGLYLVPVGGGERTRITNHESDRSPVFSPDGSQVAYMSTRNGNWDIYTVSTAGSAPFQVTTGPGNEGLPAWSPDGSQLAYVSDADGSWAIYVVSAAGGTPAKVTEWDGRNRADWLMSQIGWSNN